MLLWVLRSYFLRLEVVRVDTMIKVGGNKPTYLLVIHQDEDDFWAEKTSIQKMFAKRKPVWTWEKKFASSVSNSTINSLDYHPITQLISHSKEIYLHSSFKPYYINISYTAMRKPKPSSVRKNKKTPFKAEYFPVRNVKQAAYGSYTASSNYKN